MPNRLLILACSQRKRPIRERLLAPIDLYDGPAWRTVRAYRGLDGRHDLNLTVLALSAKYGIVHASDEEIWWYEEKLTRQKAFDTVWTQASVVAPLEMHLAQIFLLERVCICGGALYRHALAGVTWPEHLAVLTTSGGIGAQLGQLKTWLHTAR